MSNPTTQEVENERAPEPLLEQQQKNRRKKHPKRKKKETERRKKLRVAPLLPRCDFFPLYGYKRGERERIQVIPKYKP
jgi:hypothetical protein